ncbi:hypothetical protein [Natranaerofaba carboxydovora]|uniref:hypothetical protein n=1 Tax=Natranaerofaba carboxydovora TaxID=2742683 RepID=UPI001F145DC9|nr:hypothetical protein [Natranaerofaba carboxydovora]UMZ74985.1 hypothetical protein ACONDI_02591 [Natranaerofaba carboxydovora]
MEKLDDWIKYLEKYKLNLARLQEITDKQDTCLKDGRFDDYVEITNEKSKILDKQNKLEEKITALKEEYKDLITEDNDRLNSSYLSKIRKLQDEINILMEDVFNRSKEHEEQLLKLTGHNDLKKLKKSMGTKLYSKKKAQNNEGKKKGAHFDKKN